APAVDVGEIDVERDGVGVDLACQQEGGGAAGGDDGLEAVLVGHFQQEACEVGVVLDDQQHAVAAGDVAGVVGELHGLRRGSRGGEVGGGQGEGEAGVGL